MKGRVDFGYNRLICDRDRVHWIDENGGHRLGIVLSSRVYGGFNEDLMLILSDVFHPSEINEVLMSQVQYHPSRAERKEE